MILAAACATGQTAKAVSPRWAHTGYPCRVRFSLPAGANATALLPFYHADLGFEPDAFRIHGPPPDYPLLPWRRLGRSPDRTLALIQLPGDTLPPNTPILAYAAPAGTPRQDERPDLEPPFPIRASFFSLRGHGTPDTLPRLTYMLQAAPRPTRVTPVREFPPDLPPEGRSALVQFHAFVLCPENGTYTFRASDGAPLFLFLNDRPVSNADARVRGPDCVELRLVTATPNGQSRVRLDWKPPGAAAFQPIPGSAYAGAALARPRKLEKLDRTLQPQFEADCKPPYAFRGLPGVFYPLQLTDRSENWLPYAMTRSWTFSNGATNAAASPALTFTNPGPHTVTLTLEDELGFSNSLTHAVGWDPAAIPRFYQLAATPFPMAAAWFRADTLEPAIATQGNWPVACDILLTATLRRLNGAEEVRTFSIPPSHSPRVTRLGACPAGEFDSLAWTVSHHGVALTNGRFAAWQSPFPKGSPRLACDRLEDATGHTLLLVTPRRRPDLSTSAVASNAPLILIDDFLTAPAAPSPAGTPDGFAALLAEFLNDPVQVRPLSDWREAADASKPLLKLVEAPAFAGAEPARLFLAIGGQDCAAGIAADSFERQAAALTDLLLGAGHTVTWLTPPPFPNRADKARQYAVAIRRVAESRNLPVADLYTLFAGAAPDGAALFDDLFSEFLSPHGRRLAAERLAERMRRPAPGEPPREP